MDIGSLSKAEDQPERIRKYKRRGLDETLVKPSSRYGWLKDGRVIVLALVCTVAGFIAAALIFGKPWHLPPDWGDIPTWLATIAAIAAGAVAYNVYRIESRRDQVSAEERRSMQAAKVAAWYGSRQGGPITTWIGGTVQTHTAPRSVWGAFLRNASDLPVADLTVKFYFSAPGADASDAGNPYTVMTEILPPNDEPVHMPIDEAVLRTYSSDPKVDGFHCVEIEFTDTQGVRWHRDFKGRLKDITDTLRD